MKQQNRIKFSIVVPVFNEEGSAPTLHALLTDVMRASESPMRLSSSTTAAQTGSPAILKRHSRKQTLAFALSRSGEILAKRRR